MRSAVGRVVFAIDRVNDGWWWCCKVLGAEAQARLAAVLNMVYMFDSGQVMQNLNNDNNTSIDALNGRQ